MKIPLISVLVTIAAISSANALTSDDIAPASLPGKSFIFTITTSEGLPSKSGVWKGTFDDAPGTGFTITNLSGNMASSDTTYLATSVTTSLPVTTIQLPRVYSPGRDFTQLALAITGNTGAFSMTTASAGIAAQISSQAGTFTLEGAAAAPEISVQQPQTKELIDGKVSISFGSVKVGRSGMTKTFYITNLGDAELTGLSITKDGKNKDDFAVGTLAKMTLPSKSSVQFKVTFKPAAKGTKNAAIHIKSNDSNESPFDIKLTGIAKK